MKYVIRISKRNRLFYLHEDGIFLTWMANSAKRFDIYEEAEEVAKCLTSGWTTAVVVVDYNLPSY